MDARLDEQLAALGTMSSAQLRDEWRSVFREPAPAMSPDLLARGIAYRLQERVFGGLPASTKREIKRLVRDYEKNGSVGAAPEVQLKPGTRLSRDWGGRTHHVLVMDEGFIFQDRQFNSLTQIAHAITGTNWSGPRFFGLRRRSK
jgi:hypothetical protein